MNHRLNVENSRWYQNQRWKLIWDKFSGEPVYWLSGTRHIGGVSLIWAFIRNCGNLYSNVKGKAQATEIARLNTDVLYRGGLTRSSVEAAVMAVERRG